MEAEHNIYRLQSTPGLILALGDMGLNKLIMLDSLLAGRMDALLADREQIMYEIDWRMEPDGTSS